MRLLLRWIRTAIFAAPLFFMATVQCATFNPILEVQPVSTAPITVSSTGVAPTLSYTVTNNSSAPARAISVDAGFQVDSNVVTATLLSNGCSGITLPYKSVCSFVVSLQGTGKAGTTTLSPRVCKSNGAVCSQPLSTERVTINGQGVPTLQYVTVAPSAATIYIGASESLAATGHYTDGSQQALSSGVSWSSSSTNVATVNGGGQVIGVSAGTSNVTATYSGVTSSPAVMTVITPTLQSISIEPTSVQTHIGAQRQFSAVGSYSDGSKKTITDKVQWNTSSSGVAIINGSGLSTGVSPGPTNIRAQMNGILSNTAMLTVSSATVSSISVTPATASVFVGAQQQFQAEATYSGLPIEYDNVTGGATWSSSNGAATVTVGVATGVTPGTTNITASVGGKTSNSAVLNVNTSTLQSILISPALVGLSTQGTPSQTQQQYSAIGRYADGTTQDITSQVTWSSSSASVATITRNGGLATAVGTGASNITASRNSVVSNTGILNVTTAPTTDYFLMWQIPTANVTFPVYVYQAGAQVAYIPSATLQVFVGEYLPGTTTATYQLYFQDSTSSTGWRGCTYKIVNGNPAEARNNPCPGETITQNGGNSGATSNVYSATFGANVLGVVSAPVNPVATSYTSRSIKIINNTTHAYIQIGESCSTSSVSPCQTTTNLTQIAKGQSYFLPFVGSSGLDSAAFYLTAFCDATDCTTNPSSWTQTGGYFPGQTPYATKIEPSILTVSASNVPAGASNIDVSAVDGYNAGVKLYPDPAQYCTYTVPPEDSNTLGASYYGPGHPLAQNAEASSVLSNLCSQSSQLYSGYSGSFSPWTLLLSSSGDFLGCRSPCSYAKLSSPSNQDQFCCTGSYNTPSTCIVAAGNVGANTSTYNTNVVNNFQNVYGFAYGDAGSDYACPPETNFVIEFTAG